MPNDPAGLHRLIDEIVSASGLLIALAGIITIVALLKGSPKTKAYCVIGFVVVAGVIFFTGHRP